jgi:hypothetical protein
MKELRGLVGVEQGFVKRGRRLPVVNFRLT